jgi:hypothetical protein
LPDQIPSREQVIAAVKDVLSPEDIEGLSAHYLDDEDFLMAIYATLIETGIDDPDAFLRERDILE